MGRRKKATRKQAIKSEPATKVVKRVTKRLVKENVKAKVSPAKKEIISQRRSNRKRVPRKSDYLQAFDDKVIENALRMINEDTETKDSEEIDYGAELKKVLGVANGGLNGDGQQDDGSGKESLRSNEKNNKGSPSKPPVFNAATISDNDIDIDIYDDDEVQDKDFELARHRIPGQNKRGRKRVPARQAVISVRKTLSSVDEDDKDQAEDNQRFASHIQAPRSVENSKYKEVYESIPKLRSVSPPRFTTKGIMKKKLDCEELGVKIVGKTLGNPFSNYSKKRNGIIYGNQALNTIEEMEKFTGAALKIKQVLHKQSRAVRLSSYVRPDVLTTKRKELVKGRRKIRAKVVEEDDDDIDVDIETVDEMEDQVTLEPEEDIKPIARKRHTRGRKPGRSILECEDCGYKTTHSGHMKVHIVCVHKDVKLLECQYNGCGYRCSRKGSMTRHEKCVHRKDKVFKCEQCPFESAWSISLERHIITKHEKLKPWTCQLCKRSFGQQFTLTQHMNTVHKKMKRIRCAFCVFRSSTKVSVRSHILRMHKAEIAKAVSEVEESQGKGQAIIEEPEDNMMIATFSPLSEADVIGAPADSTEGDWSIKSSLTNEEPATSTSTNA